MGANADDELMMGAAAAASATSYGVVAKQAALKERRYRRRVPPLYPLTCAHEGRAGMSAVDSATRWGRLLAAVADSILV